MEKIEGKKLALLLIMLVIIIMIFVLIYAFYINFYCQNVREIIIISDEPSRKIEIPNNLENNSLIELKENEIYTIKIPKINEDNFIINLLNSSNVEKNIITSSFFVEEKKFSKLITLKPHKILTIKKICDNWLIINK
jgi:hypothetical protein